MTSCIHGLSIPKVRSVGKLHVTCAAAELGAAAVLGCHALVSAAPVARLYRWQLWSSDAVAARACAPPAPAHTAVTASVCAGQECSAAGMLHSHRLYVDVLTLICQCVVCQDMPCNHAAHASQQQRQQQNTQRVRRRWGAAQVFIVQYTSYGNNSYNEPSRKCSAAGVLHRCFHHTVHES